MNNNKNIVSLSRSQFHFYAITYKMIPVILNASYGGFRFSKDAIEEYNKRKLEQDDTFTPLIHKRAKRDTNLRLDPVMAKVVSDLGDRASVRCSNLIVHEVEERYKDYLHIEEYDGYEELEIMNATYILDEIDKVVKSTDSTQDKVDSIEMLLQQRDDK